ncbi:PUA domain-containing protein [Geoglobus ahangari]
MEVRELRKKELKVLRNALRFFGRDNFLRTYVFFVVEGERRELFVCTKDAWELRGLASLRSLGVKVGEIGSRRLRLTLEGASMLAGNRKRVFVGEKGEMLFLYGRDVFASSVLDVDRDVRQNDVVFVVNKYGDVLGLGRARLDGVRMLEAEEDRVVVENLVDRGEYLRKEKLYNAY